MLYELFGMLLSSPDLGPKLKKHVSVTETAKTSAEIRSILVSLLWLLLGSPGLLLVLLGCSWAALCSLVASWLLGLLLLVCAPPCP